jgi:SAM-dependent methyltransferase
MDIFGNALNAHFTTGKADTLWLHNSYDEPEEMPIDIFFRTPHEMPELERHALNLCYGKVLDVGAGVGSHALLLQERGLDVTAIDISAEAVQIMQQRGVKKAIVQDVFTTTTTYDTLLFLMNGIGLTGTLAGLNAFLVQAKSMINPNGQLIFDSSDISYLYADQQMPTSEYYGEVSYQYEYQGQKGSWFQWLYIDQQLLLQRASELGWKCEIIFDDGEDQYLARLTES